MPDLSTKPVLMTYAYRLIVICIIACSLIYLVVAGYIPVREIALEGYGLKALLGNGAAEGWKPILSRIVLDSKVPWLTEAGLFLQVNSKENVGGRLARNLGEICYAVRTIQEGVTQNNDICPPEDFARTRYAVETLKNVGFIQISLYGKVSYESYELNALGLKAFEAVREKWLSEGDDKSRRLALMDIQYPGFKGRLMAAHDWFESVSK